MIEKKPLEDLTYKVIGAAMRVHNALGPGLKEAAYQKGLSLEMERAGLTFEAEWPVEIFLMGQALGFCILTTSSRANWSLRRRLSRTC